MKITFEQLIRLHDELMELQQKARSANQMKVAAQVLLAACHILDAAREVGA